MPPKLCEKQHSRPHFSRCEHLYLPHLASTSPRISRIVGCGILASQGNNKDRSHKVCLTPRIHNVSPTATKTLLRSHSKFSHAVTLHTSNGHGRVPLLKSLSALHTQASRPSALLGYLHNEHTHWRYVQATLPSPKSFLPIFYIKAELSTFH